jgi:hypothetical protein
LSVSASKNKDKNCLPIYKHADSKTRAKTKYGISGYKLGNIKQKFCDRIAGGERCGVLGALRNKEVP